MVNQANVYAPRGGLGQNSQSGGVQYIDRRAELLARSRIVDSGMITPAWQTCKSGATTLLAPAAYASGQRHSLFVLSAVDLIAGKTITMICECSTDGGGSWRTFATGITTGPHSNPVDVDTGLSLQGSFLTRYSVLPSGGDVTVSFAHSVS